MGKESGPDSLAKSSFVLTMIGTVLYCGVVIFFIL